MSTQTPTSIDRVAFFAGQTLTATDLQAAFDRERQLRWLHNRTLHGSGVVMGLRAVAFDGGRRVRIEPGLAIDPAGRELVLDEPVVREVPPFFDEDPKPEPVAIEVVISYLSDDGQRPTEVDGACGTRGAVRLDDGPAVTLRRITEEDPGAGGVLLATGSVENCKLKGPLDLTRRTVLQCPDRPYVATGRTDPAFTVWTPEPARPRAFRTRVSTMSAGFRSVPEYLANVDGDSRLSTGVNGGTTTVAAITRIENSASTGFDLLVLFPPGDDHMNTDAVVEDAGFPDLIRTTLEWSVTWLGIER